MKKKPTDEEIREDNLLIDEYMGADASNAERQINNLIRKYHTGELTVSRLRLELLKRRRNELESAFSWVSSIGEQFFDRCKTVTDMVEEYEKRRRANDRPEPAWNTRDTTSAIERMTDDELAEEQRVLNAEIEAATQRLCRVENELFYRQHPECKRS